MVIAGDMLERWTNGKILALPHRVLPTTQDRYSIIRFNALHPDTLVQPLPQFVSSDHPARYTPVTMRRHMETTMSNLDKGIPAWEHGNPGRSLTATYAYELEGHRHRGGVER